jgi:hypothetical protein
MNATATHLPSSDERLDATPSTLAPVAWLWVGLVAATTTLVLLLLAGRYGVHRDEFYYLAGGRRLAWGYTDHPPLTPLLARVQADLLGTSVTAFRVVPSVFAGLAVIVTALVTRELGGRRWAQIVAAVAAALLPTIRAPHFLLGTTSTDLLLWGAFILVAVRLLRTRDPRWWWAIGAVTGVGLLNKHTIGFAVVLLCGGLLLTAGRDLLWRWQAFAGGAIALLLWVPHLWWQIDHDVPAIEFASSVSEDNGGAIGGLPDFVLELGALWAFVGLVVAWWGLRWLLRADDGRPWRALGIGVLLVVPLVALAGGKSYYVAPLAYVLVPAACVAVQANHGERRRLVGLVVAAGLFSAPITLPLLPASDLDIIADVNKEFGEMVGWDELPAQVAEVYDTLPPDEKASAIIFTGDYSEAGVLDLYRDDLALPPVYSGHNSWAYWGPPPGRAEPVIVVGIDESQLDWCADLERAGTVTNEAGLVNEEAGDPIWVCRGLTANWSTLWPDRAHID